MTEQAFSRRTLLNLGAIGLSSVATSRISLAQAAQDSVLSLTANSDAGAFNFNGKTPGPVLRIPADRPTVVALDNRTKQPLVFDAQGARVQNLLIDGGAPHMHLSPPGGDRIALPAREPGLCLYRALGGHLESEPQLRGLYGALIVEDRQAYPADRELVYVFGETGEKKPGFSGPWINGQALPFKLALAGGERVRLRGINASPWRAIQLSFADIRPYVIAIDGQPCDPFEPLQRSVPMGPGARFELVFDAPSEGEAAIRISDTQDRIIDAVTITATGDSKPARGEVVALPFNPALPPQIPLQNALRREMVISEAGTQSFSFSYAGSALSSFSAKPLFTANVAQPVSLGVSNHSKILFALHAQGASLRLLHDLDDGWAPYWRDTILIEPGKAHHVAFLAGTAGRWRIDCLPCVVGLSCPGSWFEVR